MRRNQIIKNREKYYVVLAACVISDYYVVRFMGVNTKDRNEAVDITRDYLSRTGEVIYLNALERVDIWGWPKCYGHNARLLADFDGIIFSKSKTIKAKRKDDPHKFFDEMRLESYSKSWKWILGGSKEM